MLAVMLKTLQLSAKILKTIAKNLENLKKVN